MKTWRASFVGRLKNQETGEIVNASFSLETESCMGHFAFGSHVNPHLVAEALSHEKFSKELFDELQAAHQEHYEQFCHVRGTFKFGQQQYPIHAKGMRDRAFGVREWGYLQRYIAAYFWAGEMDNGPSVTLVMASMPPMTAAKFGFVSENEGLDAVAVDAMSGKLVDMANNGIPPQEWEWAFRCNGKYYLIRCFALPDDSVGLNMKDAMWINLRFTHYELSWIDPVTMEYSSRKGIGASEFGYRFQGYQPVRPKSKLAAPVHAKMH